MHREKSPTVGLTSPFTLKKTHPIQLNNHQTKKKNKTKKLKSAQLIMNKKCPLMSQFLLECLEST